MSVSGREGALMAGRDGYGPGLTKALEEAIKAGGYKMEVITADPVEEKRWHEVASPLWGQWIAATEAKGLPGREAFDKLQEIMDRYRIK